MKKQTDSNLRRFVKSKQALYGITTKELAVACRVSVTTLNLHLQEPDRITLKELRTLSKKLHTSIIDFIGE